MVVVMNSANILIHMYAFICTNVYTCMASIVNANVIVWVQYNMYVYVPTCT